MNFVLELDKSQKLWFGLCEHISSIRGNQSDYDPHVPPQPSCWGQQRSSYDKQQSFVFSCQTKPVA